MLTDQTLPFRHVLKDRGLGALGGLGAIQPLTVSYIWRTFRQPLACCYDIFVWRLQKLPSQCEAWSVIQFTQKTTSLVSHRFAVKLVAFTLHKHQDLEGPSRTWARAEEQHIPGQERKRSLRPKRRQLFAQQVLQRKIRRLSRLAAEQHSHHKFRIDHQYTVHDLGELWVSDWPVNIQTQAAEILTLLHTDTHQSLTVPSRLIYFSCSMVHFLCIRFTHPWCLQCDSDSRIFQLGSIKTSNKRSRLSSPVCLKGPEQINVQIY